MAAEILKIRSLGAFSFFNEFEVAFILLLIVRLLFSSVLCVFLSFDLGSQSSWHICWKVVPFPSSLLYLAGVRGSLGGQVYQCRASLSRLTRLCCLPFVSLSVWRLAFFLLFQYSWPVAERSTEWLYVPSRGGEYFGEAVFLAKHVSLSFKWLQQNECDSGFPSWHEHLSSYISFWKISTFSLPWSYTAFKAFYILL